MPAGGALAVDRDGFSAAVTAALEAHPLITIEREEVAGLPPAGVGDGDRRDRPPHLARRSPRRSVALTGETSSPSSTPSRRSSIAKTIDMDVAWFQSRYDKAGPGGTGADYINCPLDRDAVRGLRRRAARRRKTEFKEWEATRPISTAACRSR